MTDTPHAEPEFEKLLNDAIELAQAACEWEQPDTIADAEAARAAVLSYVKRLKRLAKARAGQLDTLERSMRRRIAELEAEAVKAENEWTEIIAGVKEFYDAKAAALEAELREIACSGVEHEDSRLSYVTTQIDYDVWKAIQRFKAATGTDTRSAGEVADPGTGRSTE